MKFRCPFFFASLLLNLAATTPISLAEGSSGLPTVMKSMPADWPLNVVFMDAVKFDKAMKAFQQRVDSGSSNDGIVEGIKSELGIGDWIDFSKPLGVAISTFDGSEEPVVWAHVPDATSKLKGSSKAKEEDGIWHLTFDGGEELYGKVLNDYVVVAGSRDLLNRALKIEKSFADEVASRSDVVAGKDLFAHLNFDPLRDMAVAQIAQMAPMASMFGMMMAQQMGSGDATFLSGGLTLLFDSMKQFVEQVSYLEGGVSLNDTDGHITLLTGYRDGPIKSYLTKTQPASSTLFGQIEEQPYALAFGYHIPGTSSPFMDYVFGEMDKVIAAPSGASGSGDASTPDSRESIKAAMRTLRDVYTSVEGVNMVVAKTGENMSISGDYVGGDQRKLLDLLKKATTLPNPMKGGSTPVYESAGTRKIGETEVEDFNMKIDPSDPTSEQTRAFFGDSPRLTLGLGKGCVRFCMGNPKATDRAFSSEAGKPFASGQQVKQAVDSLPARRNFVALVELGGVLNIFGPMFGMSLKEPIPPAAPIAASVSLAGNPARVDVKIPLRSIERIVQAMGAEQPN